MNHIFFFFFIFTKYCLEANNKCEKRKLNQPNKN